jgi:hypothetical protein
MNTDSSFRYGSEGGALEFNEPTYVRRNADNKLYEALKKGTYCCVLNSRQTGKSSLKVDLFHKLGQESIACADIDLTSCIATETTHRPTDSEAFYNDFIAELIESLETCGITLDFDRKIWWQKHDDLSPIHRFSIFIKQIILKQISQNLVIFVDEIDKILKLDVRSDFFALIRSFYNKRSIQSDYKRLTFVLLGVATPSDLIEDKSVTSFNIGQVITLEPFTLDDVSTLIKILGKALNKLENESRVLMEEILNRTGGQPFLTQKLCDLIVTEHQNNSSATVQEVVNAKIINNWLNQDHPDHFKTIQGRFSEGTNKPLIFRSLDLYKKILQSENKSWKADNSQEQIELKLSGLVLQQENILKPYNCIYTEIFDLDWVEAEMRKIRLFANELDLWKNEDEKQKQLHLLYGRKYEDAKKWREDFIQQGGYIEEGENDFIDQSSKFWEAIQKAFPQWCDRELMINSMNDWTSGFGDFNDRILQIAENNHSYLTIGDSLRTLVEENLEDFKKDKKFQEDRKQLLNQEDSFELISIFKRIAQKELIPFDNKNPQHQKLKAMCFIILDKEHNLRILNKIYEKILSQDWIKGVMAKLRPYTNAFQNWKDSDRQKSSYLLQNSNLKLALEWLGKKPTPTLEEGEIKFVMTSLVAEVWATPSPSVQDEAVSLIITFRPSLQGKNNYSDFLLREILQWTKSQIPALEKLLGWVNKYEIPVENNREWLESLVRSHIKNWSYQELFNFGLDPHGSWNKEEQEVFIIFDEYLGINKSQKFIPKETLKKHEKILDKYQKINKNDFQELVFPFLKREIARISLMSKQQQLDVLLDEIVIGSKGHLKSILIFDLQNGLPLYHNKQLKDDDPALYQALFAEGGEVAVGEAIEGFDSLSEIQEALDSFGDVTKFGNLIYSIFRLKEGTMMVYFLNLTTSLAICFIAPDGINLGLVVTRSQAKIKDIKNELEDLGF